MFGGVASTCDFVNVCVTDATDADCSVPGQVMVPFAGLFGCCPGCEQPSGKHNTSPS